ncbi:MAG: ATP-dependent protease ATPase subunit HslU [Candidatus Cloacimonetes bacterium]|nr:ATP-dependent protease ATPase subunit HslU [Candidatus Cloacimonadota bacterium]
MQELTPRRIVVELDKYIIGQDDAKRAVAIALRNRWRRQQVGGELRQEIMPNNIILIGPTGVGKTEIARRLSRLADAPFIKVEASKFTEVGYVGRDVESMIRELFDIAINEVRTEMTRQVRDKAASAAREKVLDLLLPPLRIQSDDPNESDDDFRERLGRQERTRNKLAGMLDAGRLDDREVEFEQQRGVTPPHIEIFSGFGLEQFEANLGEMLGNMMPQKREQGSRRMKVPQALAWLTEQEQGRMVSKDKVLAEAKRRVEENGIVFIDEIDKIASRETDGRADVSRAGVQRDLLPIIEGSSVPTKHGIIDTSHILFIAAGAFHTVKPSDLIPELQGRFPIRVELNSLTEEDFKLILAQPENALTKQYVALFLTEGVKLKFTKGAIAAIAAMAAAANRKMEDIGARRLHTVVNTLLDEYLYQMPETVYDTVKIEAKTVHQRLDDIIRDDDLSRYIL